MSVCGCLSLFLRTCWTGNLSNVSLTVSFQLGFVSACFTNSFCAKLKVSLLLPLSPPVHPDSVVCSSSVTRLNKSLRCPTARWVTTRFKSTFTVKSQDLIFHLFFFSFLIILKILSWTYLPVLADWNEPTLSLRPDTAPVKNRHHILFMEPERY